MRRRELLAREQQRRDLEEVEAQAALRRGQLLFRLFRKPQELLLDPLLEGWRCCWLPWHCRSLMPGFSLWMLWSVLLFVTEPRYYQ